MWKSALKVLTPNRTTILLVVFRGGDSDCLEQKSCVCSQLHQLQRKYRVKFEKNKINPINKVIGIEEAHHIEKSIAQLSPIKQVNCYMGYNGKLHINLYQRCPIFRVLTSKGESYYIDAERRTMPVSNLFTAYTPVVTGNVSKKVAQNELYDFMQYLLTDKDWSSLFAEVHLDEKQNIRLTSRQGIPYVELGKLNNYLSKMEKLRVWYQQYPHKNDATVYKKITITYDELIFCIKNTQPWVSQPTSQP